MSPKLISACNHDPDHSLCRACKDDNIQRVREHEQAKAAKRKERATARKRAATKTKKKSKTPAQLADECAVLLQRVVRMKAAINARSAYISCASCGCIKHWKEMQGGHFIPRGRSPTKLVEENIHPQCPACNGPKRGNIHEYSVYMTEMYGLEFIKELNATARQTGWKWNRDDLEDLKRELQQRIKDYEKETCE